MEDKKKKSIILKRKCVTNVLRKFHSFQFKYMGNMTPFDNYLKEKHIIFQIPFWVFRAMSQPIFVNNPLSGILIFCSLLIYDRYVAVCGLISLISAILTALLTGQERSNISSGLITFNGHLVGLLVPFIINKSEYFKWTLLLCIFIGIIRFVN